MSEERRRHLAALLSADVVGYSRLMTDDEQATVATLEQYRAAMAALVAQHEGRVVNAVGDNLLAEFHSVVDAVASSIDIQRELARRNQALPEPRRMRWRIGVNLGDIMVDGDDVYGDGINIAARLEGMAEPGAICISGTVHEQIRGKIACDPEDLGDQNLKNIEYPVRVFRIRVAESAAMDTATAQVQTGRRPEPDARELTVPGFGGKPAIAVLAFDNLSADPDQSYLADGIAEDLITALALARQFPVIARNSSFVYKGRAVDIKEVSRDLGVRYVVEGSVRRAGDRIRVTAQLIDAVSGHHLWAERYDRELKDLFDLQDELVEAMLGALAPALGVSERRRIVRKHVADLTAWECLVRGTALLEGAAGSDETAEQAGVLFERAIDLDPRLGDAYFGLASIGVYRLVNAIEQNPEPILAKMAEVAARATKNAPDDPAAHLARVMACNFGGDPQAGLEAADRALAINPSLALAHTLRGASLWMRGQPEAAIPAIEKSIRLSPNDPFRFIMDLHLANAHLMAGHFQDALTHARASFGNAPQYSGVVRLLTVCCAYAESKEEASAALEQHQALVPDFDPELLRLIFPAFAADRYIEGLRMARSGESPPPGLGHVRVDP